MAAKSVGKDPISATLLAHPNRKRHHRLGPTFRDMFISICRQRANDMGPLKSLVPRVDHRDRPLGVLLLDYDSRLRAMPGYKEVVDDFLAKLELCTSENKAKCKYLELMDHYFVADSKGSYSDDHLMMILSVNVQLVNDSLLNVHNPRPAIDWLMWLENDLLKYPKQQEAAQQIEKWLVHYDTLMNIDRQIWLTSRSGPVSQNNPEQNRQQVPASAPKAQGKKTLTLQTQTLHSQVVGSDKLNITINRSKAPSPSQTSRPTRAYSPCRPATLPISDGTTKGGASLIKAGQLKKPCTIIAFPAPSTSTDVPSTSYEAPSTLPSSDGATTGGASLIKPQKLEKPSTITYPAPSTSYSAPQKLDDVQSLPHGSPLKSNGAAAMLQSVVVRKEENATESHNDGFESFCQAADAVIESWTTQRESDENLVNVSQHLPDNIFQDESDEEEESYGSNTVSECTETDNRD